MKSSKLDNSSVEFTEASPPEESESDPRVKLYTDVERNVDKEFDVGKARTHDDYKIEKDLKSLVKGCIWIITILYVGLVFAFVIYLVFPATHGRLFGDSIHQVKEILKGSVGILMSGVIGVFVGKFLGR